MSLELEASPCPRCGSAESRHLFGGRDYLYDVPGSFSAAECTSCALWFQNPRPTPVTIGEAYPAGYSPHVSQEDEIAPPLEPRIAQFLTGELGYPDPPMKPRAAPRWWQRWKATVDLIPRFVEGGSVLEIGAATGGRLRGLHALGWRDLHGIELMEFAAAVARRSGFDIRTGPIESVIGEIPDASFDVVVASFVIEHLYDPFAIVSHVARVLKPGGEFLFCTITRDSLDARVWGRFWAGYDFPRHMVYFSNDDLRRMTAEHFQWEADARHDAIQDYGREAWWRLMDHRNLTDRVVGRLVKTAVGRGLSTMLAWSGAACRISVRCRRR